MGTQRRFNIPTELRAIARVVFDVDVRQFPDLAPASGRTVPSASALRRITTELNNGVPLTSQEFKLFRAAYEECRQHLHGVTKGIISSGSPIADVLVLAVRMDALATGIGLSLLTLFPVLRDIHPFLLELSDRLALGCGEAQRQNLLLDRLTRFLYRTLERGERALRDYEALGLSSTVSKFDASTDTKTTVRGTPDPTSADRGSAAAASRFAEDGVAASGDSGSHPGPSRPYPRASQSLAGTADPSYNLSLKSSNHSSVKDSSVSVASDVLADRQKEMTLEELRRLPISISDVIASVNADLLAQYAHLRWYTKVMDQASVFLDAHEYLEEHALRVTWDTHVGRNRAACTTDEFSPFLPLFPEWLRPVVLSVVDFKGCGVVSLYSLRRLLQVWGPLQLLEVNLRHDMEQAVLDLSEPFDYLACSLAHKTDAQIGDYVVGLSENLGELHVAVLRRARHHRSTTKLSLSPHNSSSYQASPLHSNTYRGGRTSFLIAHATGSRKGMTTVCYTLSQASGAWMVQGLAHEEFGSVADACSGFSEIFRRPRGQLLKVFGDSAPPSTTGVRTSALSSTTEGTLHTPLGSSTLSPARAAFSDLADGSASPLHRACYRNNSRYVRTLLERGGGTLVNAALVDPLVCECFCWTPLLCAVNNPHSDPVDVVRQLLAAGAEVTYMDDAHCTALFYAIANGYAETTRVLLQHCASMSTSPFTVPLLVAIGANHCLQRACDVQRLVEVIPSAAVLREVVPYECNLALVALAATILEEKLNGHDHHVSAGERRLVAQQCSAGESGAERFTPAESEELNMWVRQHTRSCLQARYDVEEAVRVIYARQYVLSWREWIDTLSTARVDAVAAQRGVRVGPLTMLQHSTLLTLPPIRRQPRHLLPPSLVKRRSATRIGSELAQSEGSKTTVLPPVVGMELIEYTI